MPKRSFSLRFTYKISYISIFSHFVVYSDNFIIHIDLTRIAASYIATDDLTN